MRILEVPKNDLKAIFYIFNRRIGIFILFVFIFFLDSTYFAENYTNSQLPINIIMILGFLVMYFRANKRTKELMFYAVIIGFGGEYLFSRALDMYTYRLENVPLYVPFGHAALYGRIFMFSKAPIVKKHNKAIEELFAVIIILLATIYLVFFKDVFGFVMTAIVFLLLWKRPKDRLFFFSMYLLVAILEIGGTAFGCWQWPNTAFGVFIFLPSNNPPSGISLFYFLLDISCFFIYTQRHNVSWQRLKNIKNL
ncbi:hypothetical protein SHK09_12310 [Polaribacter sp. PL03]|uniref:hypothetical protein n=1 Tax=Polaribacter sp. PL03 TaxID=3088353 RepID=UPI0029D05E47|nr:hypothetical protein [Polaribacter sp. PL03]MDX6747579.1 hypothetical protein [Polaribacter sp. PL03]